MQSEIHGPVTLDVREYGAVGDGATLDTRALQAAIDACTAQGGGTVLVPKGIYLTGTLVMRDNVTLYLMPDATLLGSKDIDDYVLEGEAAGRRNCLLYAQGARNIALMGEGIIDGQGEAFPCVSRLGSIPAFRGEKPRMPEERKKWPPRPMLIIFTKCEDVRVGGVTIKDSPSWGLHLVACTRVWIEGTRVRNRARPNGDGIDLESCRHVFISNCDISCDDDAICLKSSIADLPCEHIVVTNCVISSNTAAVKFGTPSRAGFRDIVISNCAFYHCALGAVKLEAVDGGVLEEVVIDNIAMHEVEGPFFLRLGNRAARLHVPGVAREGYEPADAPIPVGLLRNVMISNIRATVRPVEVRDPMMRVDVDDKAKIGIMITGIPGYVVENVTLSDIHITFPGGGTREDAAIEVPEDERMYPEQFFFGALPAYGAYLRHVKGITFHNVRFDLAEPDLRPAIYAEDVEDLELSAFRAAGDVDADAVIRLVGARDVFVHGSRPLTQVSAFIRVEGGAPDEVVMSDNDVRLARTSLDLAD
ncbi:MAG: glycoside hydrolase family 28 protein [Anaerolineae bacterium]